MHGNQFMTSSQEQTHAPSNSVMKQVMLSFFLIFKLINETINENKTFHSFQKLYFPFRFPHYFTITYNFLFQEQFLLYELFPFQERENSETVVSESFLLVALKRRCRSFFNFIGNLSKDDVDDSERVVWKWDFGHLS